MTLQVVLTGAPDGSLSTAFIQRKSGVPVGDPLPALYASQQLLNAQPYVSGALHGGSAGSGFRSALDHRLVLTLIEQLHVISNIAACMPILLALPHRKPNAV